MKITRSQVLRNAPIVAANLVPLVGVVAYGWPVVTLFLLIVLETWILVALDALQIAMVPAQGVTSRLENAGDGLGWFIVGSLFVIVQLVAVILVLDPRRYQAASAGNAAMDLLRYVHGLGLTIPLAIVALIHLAVRVRDREGIRAGASFMRIFLLIFLFIVALGPATLTGGRQAWPLVAVVIVKAAFEIWRAEEGARDARQAGLFLEERRKYLASLDPRGTGTWPTPPPGGGRQGSS